MFRVVLASLLAQAAAFGSFCADRGDLFSNLLEDSGVDMTGWEALGISSSNICSVVVASDPSVCDYTDSENGVSAFLCISTCQVPACGGDINPIEVAFDGAFTSCTDTLLSVIASDAELSALGDDLWEYLCGFGEDRRRLTTKDGAKHAPSPALQLKLPSVQRAVAKAVAAARNLAK